MNSFRLDTSSVNRAAVAQGLLIVVGVLLVGYEPVVGITLSAIWLLPIVICIGLGLSRHRAGWQWGLFLGWLGVLILALMKPWSAADELRELEAQRQLETLQS